MEYAVNHIILHGNMVGNPEYSHENHGKIFYKFQLEIPRLSGTSDILPVIAEKRLIDSIACCPCTITVTGQIRSHNIRNDGKRHLLIFVFATALYFEDTEFMNSCSLEGVMCREPIYRRTPLGREICDIMLAVPRMFHRADYLPCILWGRTAREISAYHCGDHISVSGRMQSRNYNKQTENGIQIRTAYEISALSASKIDQFSIACKDNS